MSIKIVSWNVNGLRAAVRNGLAEFIGKESPDIMAMQEVKISDGEIPVDISSLGYDIFLNPAQKKGYSGTITMSRIPVEHVEYGLGQPEFDSEGRVITAEFQSFYLINVYFPNSQRGLARLEYKLSFNTRLHAYCNSLRKRKPLVITGDFNVAHREIDIANPRGNERNAGFTIEERNWMSEFLNDGYVDTFRLFNNEPGHYSWWSYMHNAREKNIGWRIDYFVVTSDIKDRVIASTILEGVTGSDHAPVELLLDF